MVPSNDMPAFVVIMAWRWSGNKQLSEPMTAKFTAAYMRLSASMSYLAVIRYISNGRADLAWHGYKIT